jgi:isopentenyl-diphosphate delta-isomerase
VEEYVNHGRVREADLAEWGIPTVDALREVRAALPGMPLVASGGVRSGLDIAKALAMGARVCAVAKPLLAPATESADAVTRELERLMRGLRVAMHGSGCANVGALAKLDLVAR